VDEVCALAAEQNGVIVEDDGSTTPIVKKPAVTDQDGNVLEPAVDEWAPLWDALSGWDAGNIINGVFTLNVTLAAGRIARLGERSRSPRD
jgi:hypothetical protein